MRSKTGEAASRPDPPVVAIINTSPDTVEIVSEVLEKAGFVVVAGYTYDIRSGRLDFESFVRQHRPIVIVYDIAPPYDRNYRLFQHVSSIELGDHCKFVLTSTNATEVQKLAGGEYHVYEVIGRPFDLGEIVRAVKEAARSRPTR